jgi:DNA-binding Lrp family transcriptional regulator
MTVGAYILIQTGVGRASDVAAQMRRLPGVSSVDAVAGPYDVIARAEADTIDALGRFVVSQMQPIDGVTRTLTSPIVAL